ncbi:MAG: zinc dependent phospholipase C family protein [Deltaproteobacteria bacterium]|nr:zinc dependent phospholipase C family protein [Deltaproteobacteria bacterium]
MIVDEAKSREDALGMGLWQFLNKYYMFLYLGAESPDLPYLSLGGKEWADAMHYRKTNGLVISGFEALRQVWSYKTPADEIQCAWLLGYVSHMVADAVIHPIVKAIVGSYEENKTEHRICELTMDSLIFQAKKHIDITYAEFSDALKFCKDAAHFPELMEFWRTQLQSNYPEIDGRSDPSFWFETYTKAIDAIEGGSTVTAFFRHLGAGGNFVYLTSEEIVNEHSEDWRKYYLEVKLPEGTGTFISHGFEKAVANLVKIWKGLYDGLSGASLQISQLVKNWDLDTGGDSDAHGVITFWV